MNRRDSPMQKSNSIRKIAVHYGRPTLLMNALQPLLSSDVY